MTGRSWKQRGNNGSEAGLDIGGGLMEILDSDTRGVLQVADHGSPSGQALSFDEFDGLAAEPRRMVSPRRS